MFRVPPWRPRERNTTERDLPRFLVEECPMKSPLPPEIAFHSEPHLLIYRPVGILSEHRVNEIIKVLEKEEDEIDTPFDRFTDLSGVEALQLDVNGMIRIALY